MELDEIVRRRLGGGQDMDDSPDPGRIRPGLDDGINRPGVHAADLMAQLLFSKETLDRSLQLPQITGIAFSGTIGIGIFITSGELIGISGSVGCVIAYVSAGLVIFGVMRSLAEMVSVRPLSGALMDYPHTFVDPALGFAVGVTYWLAQCMSMATLTAAAARISNDFSDSSNLKRKEMSGVIIGLCLITLISNVCGVRIYGTIERIVKLIKLALILFVCVLMILVKAGVGRAREPEASKGETGYGRYSLTPFLRWDGFKGPEDLDDQGYGTGISGSWGQLLSIWTSVILAMFSCMGGDIVVATAGEAASPRRDLPTATRFMYVVPIGCYVVLSILVGLNINFLDPNLFHPWAQSDSHTSQSPFIIIMKRTTIKGIPGVLNGLFLFSAYTTANTALFTSSRTLFGLAQLYGNRFVRRTLGRTSQGHTPVAAITVSSAFSLLAFLGLVDVSFNQPILSLAAFFTSAVGCIYAAECIAFLRFKAGLAARHHNNVFSRDHPEYKEKHYRAHWQPLCAIFGLVGCVTIVIFSGWPAIYLLRERHTLRTSNELKPNSSLTADVVGAYSGPLLFFTLYLSYKLLYRTRIRRISDLQEEYFLPDMGSDRARHPGDDRFDRRADGFGHVARELWRLGKAL